MTLRALFDPDRRTRTIVAVAAAAGLLIGASALADGPLVAGIARLPAYALACACIVRWVPIVRNRVSIAFVAHQAAMATIAASWAASDRPSAVVVNGLWFVSAACWYGFAGRS